MSKYILPEGVEANQETITLWKGKTHYFHDKELAECELAISQKCISCDEPTGNPYYIICEDCKIKKEDESYEKLPFKEWDGKTPLVIYKTDTYFYNEDDVVSHCDDNEINPENLNLVICEKVEIPQFRVSDLIDDIWDWDCDIPHENDIDDEINAVLRKYLTKYWDIWREGQYRTVLRDIL